MVMAWFDGMHIGSLQRVEHDGHNGRPITRSEQNDGIWLLFRTIKPKNRFLDLATAQEQVESSKVTGNRHCCKGCRLNNETRKRTMTEMGISFGARQRHGQIGHAGLYVEQTPPNNWIGAPWQ
jgi:hypothetical protein